MRTYQCTCGNGLFFDSTVCVKCKADTGMCPVCNRVAPLLSAKPDVFHCGHADCNAAVQKCANSAEIDCNRCVLMTDTTSALTCDYCSLTTVIPDLSIGDNRERWRRLERAKRRVLHVTDHIGIEFRPRDPRDGPPLSFEFKADGPHPVLTGYDNGCITINIREASDVEREKARVSLHEPKRTLVGHIRHELGHFYWNQLVSGRREPEFRALFGDERSPDYDGALATYHETGPAPNWQSRYVSAYASMHPWEDFAEIFRTYLDMVSILYTAQHFSMADCDWNDIDNMIGTYQHLGTFANELNRDMGLLDLVPEVLVPAVMDKLRFVALLTKTNEEPLTHPA